MLKAFADCFLMEDVDMAEQRLDKFKGTVEEAKELLQKVENTIPVIREQLDSLAGMSLSKVEE